MSTSRRLDIAILGSRGFPSTYGGYETLVRYLVYDWVDRGHAVTVYCRRREASRRRIWHENGARCIWTPGYDSTSLSTLSFGASAHIDACLRGFDAALIVNIANGFYLPLLRARNVATVVNTDGLEWERGKWGPTARRVFRGGAEFAARHADVLVADSLAIADIWRRDFAADSVYIPYGAPVLGKLPAHRITRLGLTPRTYVLVVARLIPENNVDLILDALDMLTDRPEVVVVGSAAGRTDLEARLSAGHDQGRLRHLGHVHDQELLAELWAHAGVYVHGHSVGGTNPGLLQAMGAGAPTLALDTPFNAEVVCNAMQMFPHDATCLAAKIEMVLATPALSKEFSARGRSTVAERYQWQDVAGRYLAAVDLALYRRATRRRGEPRTERA